MTKVKLHAPVAEMHGEFEKNSGIIRYERVEGKNILTLVKKVAN